MLPRFITLTDFGSGIKITINVMVIFSIHRPPGTECTAIKSVTAFEQVKESPEQVLNMIAGLSS